MTPIEFAMVLVSALLHAWWSTRIKASSDPLVFNLLQGGVSLALAAALLPSVRPAEIPAAVWAWLAFTSAAHAAYIFWLSRALEHGDLTLVYPIARSTPALLPLVAVPLFGEPVTAGGAVGIAVVVTGVWLVYAGASLEWRAFASPAARYALLTLAATVAYSLADKRAMSELAAGPWTSPVPRAVAFYCLLAVGHLVPFAALVVARRGLRRIAAARGQLPLASLASLVSFAGYGLILRALETAPASYVVAVRQTSVLFAVALGILQLGERPSRARLLGAGATVAGVALIALFGG
jgi:drug/metabolite transporter (DMT)-like permease